MIKLMCAKDSSKRIYRVEKVDHESGDVITSTFIEEYSLPEHISKVACDLSPNQGIMISLEITESDLG